MNSLGRLILAVAIGLITLPAWSADDIKLSVEEQARMGIVVARALRVERPDRRPAFGRVLDVTSLAALHAEITALEAVSGASTSEASRSEKLFRGGENASRRQWETAQAAARADQARLQAARLRLSLEWGEALAGMSATSRGELIERIAQGRASILRAAAPGFDAGDMAAITASLRSSDGVSRPLRVLGRAGSVDASITGTALLLLDETAALQAGAAVTVDLSRGRIAGYQIASSALLADSRGLSVYLRTAADRFQRIAVKVVLDEAASVLVEKLPENAEVVSENAAVLRWSATAKQQGAGGAGHDAEQDDD